MAGRVVTLTMNPALDLSTEVGQVVPFQKLRCTGLRRDPGGGGINVARVISRLGGRATAIYPAGGPSGEVLKRLIDKEGVESLVVPIAGDTREDFTVFETETNRQYRFVMPGPHLSDAEVRACLAALTSASHGADYCVMSGSLPPGLGQDFFAAVAKIAKALGDKLVLDTTGQGLKEALPEGVYLIKPNLNEFAELAGIASTKPEDLVKAARRFIDGGQVEAVALSMAEHGALLVSRDGAYRAQAPSVKAVSTVGAGDSFLGAFICARSNGLSWRDAFRNAVAGGSAALLSQGTDLAHPADIARLAEQVQVEEMGG